MKARLAEATKSMADQLSDSVLLEQFVSRREEAAFDTLVRRHGPTVQQVCRRVLRNEHDIEDVFQATFLVLARKAGAVPWRESVESWLRAVAHRLALGARADRARRREKVSSAVAASRLGASSGAVWLPDQYHAQADPRDDVERRDLKQLLDDELGRLPEKYRAPVVLCYLEGRTHEEAARELGWPAGSMSRRLERARLLLKRRLVYRGVTLAIGLVGLGMAIYLAGRATNTATPSAQAVRQAMASLARVPGNRLSGRWSTGAHSESALSASDLGEMVTLARQAGQVADSIKEFDPGRDRDTWRKLSYAMRRSADELGDADSSDRATLIAAARRLNSSCVNCHSLFGRKS